MKSIIKLLFAVCLAIVFSSASAPTQSEPVRVEILHKTATATPGKALPVAIKLTLDSSWHAYWKNPGDTGMPINVAWNLPQGFTDDGLKWPYPVRFDHDNIVTYGYENEVILLTTITVPESFTENEVTISADITWVACSDEMCLPGSETLSITLPLSQETALHANHSAFFDKGEALVPEVSGEIKAMMNGELIEVHLPANLEIPESAQFFPERADMVAKAIDPVIAKSNGHPVVILKSHEQFRLKNGLSGVIVVTDKSGQERAFDVTGDIAANATPLDPISMASPLAIDTMESFGEEAVDGFWMALLFAFVGGIILNLMPCVLPVISLKILSFVKIAGEDRSLILKHGIAYSLGVLASFWVLAAMLLILKSYGSSVGWGFQLQNPVFIAVLIAVIFLFALSLFGVFEMGLSLMSKAGDVSNKSGGLANAALSGVLATAVATPCTGPFLGTAVGVATTLSAPLAMLVFTSLGLGMAAPYLLLSAFPAALKFLPKPGNWMVTFKEFTGFFMVATVLWLLWVFSAEAGSAALILLLASLLFMAIGAWIYGKWSTPTNRKGTRLVGYILSGALLALSFSTLYVAAKSAPADYEIVVESNWETFSPERVAELRAAGTPVFIDFTAKWCLICQANHIVLETAAVDAVFNEKGVVRMKADWTLHDEVITAELEKFGRSGVPLYVYYPVNGEPIILPQVLTPDVVIKTVEHGNL